MDEVATGPRWTEDLLGHGTAEQALLDSWRADRMPHAWLIAGPRGIGKATLAFRFARFLFKHGRSGEGGGQNGLFGPAPLPEDLSVPADDPVFRRVAAGGHADLRVLEPGLPNPDNRSGQPARQILVGHVREAVNFTRMTAAEGNWRVVIVDPAEEMNLNAQNALLKCLEEPPEGAVILLVSHAPGRLLPTIRSRCRWLRLTSPDAATVNLLLARHLAELPAGDRETLARLCEGSVGEAIALARHGGLELFRTVLSLLDGLARPDIAALHTLGDTLRRRRGGQTEAAGEADPFEIFCSLLRRWFGRLMIAGARGEAALEIVPGEARTMERLLKAAPLDQWMEVWEKVARLLERADSASLDRKQVVVSAFLTLAAPLQAGRNAAR